MTVLCTIRAFQSCVLEKGQVSFVFQPAPYEQLQCLINKRPNSQLLVTFESSIVQECPLHVHQLNVCMFIMFSKEKNYLNLFLFPIKPLSSRHTNP